MTTNVAKDKGLCSFEICPEGIAVAYAPKSDTPEITICDCFPYTTDATDSKKNELIKNCLIKIVSQHSLQKAQCTWVLHPDYYRLTLVDAPNVPQAEYKQAIQWQIKDIINFPLDDTNIDIFYPDEDTKALKKIFVIVAQRSFLQNIIDIMQICELYPVAIDIREFAIRNLLARIAAPNETIGLISPINESTLLVFVKKSEIKFVRRIPIGLKNMANHNYSDLLIELRRSFNFCQTELKQELPTKFFLPNKPDIDRNMAQEITKNLEHEVSILNLPKIVTFKTLVNQGTEGKCWIAVGGALRNTI